MQLLCCYAIAFVLCGTNRGCTTHCLEHCWILALNITCASIDGRTGKKNSTPHRNPQFPRGAYCGSSSRQSQEMCASVYVRVCVCVGGWDLLCECMEVQRQMKMARHHRRIVGHPQGVMSFLRSGVQGQGVGITPPRSKSWNCQIKPSGSNSRDPAAQRRVRIAMLQKVAEQHEVVSLSSIMPFAKHTIERQVTHCRCMQYTMRAMKT